MKSNSIMAEYPYLKTIDPRTVVAQIRCSIEEYVKHARLKSLIIGESGGIDSALTSALLHPVCEQLGIPLIGRSITIETNTNDERRRAAMIGKSFCHDFREVDLTELYYATLSTIEEEPFEETSARDYKLRVGNIKARLRMIYLYNLSQKYKGMVLSTDNQTEYQLGFWTLHGDVGDFDPLFGLWKTEVYQVANYLLTTLSNDDHRAALQACIDCIPTDGLGITSSDVEQLGAVDYYEVDNALIAYIEHGRIDYNKRVIERHEASHFKRKNPTFLSRKEMGIEY